MRKFLYPAIAIVVAICLALVAPAHAGGCGISGLGIGQFNGYGVSGLNNGFGVSAFAGVGQPSFQSSQVFVPGIGFVSRSTARQIQNQQAINAAIARAQLNAFSAKQQKFRAPSAQAFVDVDRGRFGRIRDVEVFAQAGNGIGNATAIAEIERLGLRQRGNDTRVRAGVNGFGVATASVNTGRQPLRRRR